MGHSSQLPSPAHAAGGAYWRMAANATLRYALLPLTGPPLLLLVVASLLGALAAAAGFMGYPLLAIIGAWVGSYTYLLVDYTARGLPPPVLSIEMTAPWHEPGPLLQVCIFAGAAATAAWLRAEGNEFGAIALTVATLVLGPASIAVMAVERHVLRAIWPPALLKIVHGIGARYALLLAMALLWTLIVLAVAPHVPTVVFFALAQLALYSLATSLGGALHERRLELGLEAWESPERTAATKDAIELRERQRAIDAIYVRLRAGNVAGAFESLSAALGPGPTDPETYRWFLARSFAWEDRRVSERLAGELVARLLALGRRTEALDVVERLWTDGRRFLPRTARDLDVLKSVATELGRSASGDRLARECGPASQSGENRP